MVIFLCVTFNILYTRRNRAYVGQVTYTLLQQFRAQKRLGLCRITLIIIITKTKKS